MEYATLYNDISATYGEVIKAPLAVGLNFNFLLPSTCGS